MSIYFDNAGTTLLCIKAKKAIDDHLLDCANASTSSLQGQKAKKIIENTIEYFQKFNNAGKYEIVFTSGASESNSTIIDSIVNAWWGVVRKKPHIITSMIEHKSILLKLDNLEKIGRLEYTLLEVDKLGTVDPSNVEKAIKENTCLITIMTSNNEIGSINPIGKIAQIAHKRKIPFHSDAVQYYGKCQMDLAKMHLDAISVSFHKLYGPIGIGLLIISHALIKGYSLKGAIAGTQQDGLRGGTENIAYISSLIPCMEYNFAKRDEKNLHLQKMKDTFMEMLNKQFKTMEYKNFKESKESEPQICYMTPLKNSNPAILMISIVTYHKDFCNVKFKKLLEKNKFIVSIGSACNTASKKASHVLYALGVPDIIKRGILRISFGDLNTLVEVKALANCIIDSLKDSKKDIYLP